MIGIKHLSLLYLQAMNSNKKIHIKDLRLDELQNFALDLGVPKFRGTQIFNWIHDNFCQSFEQMKNLPKSLIKKLNDIALLDSLKLVSTKGSENSDTNKYLFETVDGNKIESVLITENERKIRSVH